jgi:hypothetical protein
MINVSAKVRLPKLVIDCPDRRFYQGVAITEVKEIHKRTLAGDDADEKKFKKYSDNYAKYRQKKGRQFMTPNLTFSGRMLASMGRGIRATKNRATITLLGRQGFKADSLERGGREFFSLSRKRQKAIEERVKRWMTKKNDLK